MPHTLLIAEDEPALREGLSEHFANTGYVVQSVARGDRVLDAVASHKPSLLLLDLMLPGLHGVEVCRQLRTRGETLPVIMLTALAAEEHVVSGLKAGADDYITKPFKLAELEARIAAQLRRAQGRFESGVMAHGCRLDLVRGEAVRGQSVQPLTQLEIELLKRLLRDQPNPVSRDELLMNVWGYKSPIETRTVDMAIAKLRAKLEEDTSSPKIILTVRERGYRLDMGQ